MKFVTRTIETYTQNTTATFDSDGKPHSYYDRPAGPDFDAFATWYNHGEIHRDGDKPALVFKEDSSNQTFFQYGLKHRDGDKPAHLDAFGKIWYVLDVKHRVNGPADIRNQLSSGGSLDIKSSPETFILYGLEVSPEIFNKIISDSKDTGRPVWISFLKELKVVSEDELQKISDVTNGWSNSLPVKWIIKALNITDDQLAQHYHPDTFDWNVIHGIGNIPSTPSASESTGTLSRFLRVADFESKNIAAETSNKLDSE